MLLLFSFLSLLVFSTSQAPSNPGELACFVSAEAGSPATQCPPELTRLKDSFKSEDYNGNLLLVDNTTSTMDVARRHANISDLLVVANTVYKGRDGCNNSIALPRGDIYLALNVKSNNLTKPQVIQSLAAVSVAEAVKELYDQHLDVSYTWPNLIALVRGIFTVGGSLVEVNREHSIWTIGFGLRTNSTHGLPNLKAAIDGYNAVHSQKLVQQCSVKTIVKIIEKFRANLAALQVDAKNGQEAVLKHLKGKSMVHFFNGTVVKVESDQKMFLSDSKNIKLEVAPNCGKLMALKNDPSTANVTVNDLVNKTYYYYFDGEVHDFGPDGELILIDSHKTKLHVPQGSSMLANKFTLQPMSCRK